MKTEIGSGPDGMANMIKCALTALGNPKGSTYQDVKKFISGEFGEEEKNVKMGILRAYKKNMITPSLDNGLHVMQVSCAPKPKPKPKKAASCVCPPKKKSAPKKSAPKKKAASKKKADACSPAKGKKKSGKSGKASAPKKLVHVKSHTRKFPKKKRSSKPKKASKSKSGSKSGPKAPKC